MAVFLSSCSDEPSDVGVNLLRDDLVSVKTFDTMDTTVVQNSSYLKKVVPLGSASRIYIGKRDGLTASTLMRFFFTLDDSLKDDFVNGNIFITEATIKLTPKYTFTDETANLDFTVHKVNNRWSSTNFSAENLPDLMYDAEDVSFNKDFNDSLYTFNIDTALVASWLRNSIDTTTATNFGIYYQPTDASGKIVGFQALTAVSSEAAKIDFVLEKPGSFVDTVQGFIISDVSVVEGDLPTLPQGEIGVQASLTAQSRLTFDLSFIPKGVVINSAQLIMTTDTLSSVFGSSFGTDINAFLLGDTTNVDSVIGTPSVMIREGDAYLGDVTNIVNSWILGTPNNGFILKPANEVEGLELFALRGSDFPDSTMRPRLKLVFTERKP